MSSHEPYQYVRSYYNNGQYNNINNPIAKNYFNSISYVDLQLNKFITHAQKEDSTLCIILFGDHTPILFDDSNTINLVHPALSINNGTKFEFVPLFILMPEHTQYSDTKKVASFLDIAPTILNLTGSDSVYRTNGQNLLNYPLLADKIAYKGKYYTRELLYTIAKATCKN
jgi:phosphoglycerol transferase MdoB-like AlkP superfamily enzyme